jgi:hypothetical protein
LDFIVKMKILGSALVLALACAAAAPVQAVTLYVRPGADPLRGGLALLPDFVNGVTGTGGANGTFTGGTSVNTGGNNPGFSGAFVNVKGQNSQNAALRRGSYLQPFPTSGTGIVRAFSFLSANVDQGVVGLNNASLVVTTQNLTSNTFTSTTFSGTQFSLANATARVYVDTGSSDIISSVEFRVVGGQNDQFNVDGFATAAPEPATWGMLILGFGMAGMGLRRRTKVQAAA